MGETNPAVIGTALRKYDKVESAKFVEVHARQDDLKRQIAELKACQRDMAEEHAKRHHEIAAVDSGLRRLETQCSVAAAPRFSPLASSSDDFNRDTDKRILIVTCNAAVSRDSVLEVLAPFIRETIPDETLETSAGGVASPPFVLEGADVGKKWIIQFHGDLTTASLRAAKIFTSRRSRAGVWRDLSLNIPGGGKEKLYIELDKNGKQTLKEMLARKLQKILNEHSGATDSRSKEWNWLRRDEGVVGRGKEKLCKIDFNEDDRPRLGWNDKAVEQLAIDKEAISAEFGKRSSAAADPEWSFRD